MDESVRMWMEMRAEKAKMGAGEEAAMKRGQAEERQGKRGARKKGGGKEEERKRSKRRQREDPPVCVSEDQDGNWERELASFRNARANSGFPVC
jgi:hypothetical protein